MKVSVICMRKCKLLCVCAQFSLCAFTPFSNYSTCFLCIGTFFLLLHHFSVYFKVFVIFPAHFTHFCNCSMCFVLNSIFSLRLHAFSACARSHALVHALVICMQVVFLCIYTLFLQLHAFLANSRVSVIILDLFFSHWNSLYLQIYTFMYGSTSCRAMVYTLHDF